MVEKIELMFPLFVMEIIDIKMNKTMNKVVIFDCIIIDICAIKFENITNIQTTNLNMEE